MKKITASDIGYYGRPIDSLTREELLDAIVELAQTSHECTAKSTPCRAIITIKE